MEISDLRIFPYNVSSKSVRGLWDTLKGAKIIKLKDSIYKHSPDRLIINWGSAALALAEHQKYGPVLNRRSSVMLCSNKLRFFDVLQDKASIPAWTTSEDVARTWMAEGKLVVGRRVLNGHSGEGIIFSDNPDFFVEPCPLYTQYIPKKAEYRVHIFRGDVIDVQQKVLRKTDDNGVEVERESINWRVRSYGNGFIFQRENVNPPEDVINQARRAFDAIPNLDFGAADVIWNDKQKRAYVLEINCAPGLEGTTLTSYAEAIRRL